MGKRAKDKSATREPQPAPSEPSFRRTGLDRGESRRIVGYCNLDWLRARFQGATDGNIATTPAETLPCQCLLMLFTRYLARLDAHLRVAIIPDL